MASSAGLERQKREILEELQKENSAKVVIVGAAGAGKTWLARELHSAIADMNYVTLWLSLSIKFDQSSLYESIARQLSLLSASDEWEGDDYSHVKRDHTLDTLEQSISAKLKEQCAHKRLLLTLDDHGNKTNAQWVLSKLLPLLPEGDPNPLKLILTSTNTQIPGEVVQGPTLEFPIEPLSPDESLTLFRSRVDNRFLQPTNFDQLSTSVAQKCTSPAAVILIAEALNHSGNQDSGSGLWTTQRALEEAADESIPLLRFASEVLPPPFDDCFWYSIELISRRGGMHYNEVISHWLIEGFLGPINHVEKAYEEGHRILMELINRGMIKIQEDNIIIMEGSVLKSVDLRLRGFVGTARVGLANVLEDDKWKGLGRITQIDGMIETLRSGKKGEKISTVLMDGSRLSREIPQTFFQRMRELEVIALFGPRLKSIPSSLSDMEKLHVLVLRDCDLLEEISCIENFKSLTVLEVSNASALKELPYNLFEKLSHLRSLNLSGLGIRSLPSVSNLKELRWLILRRCSFLEELPKVQTFTKLEVLDLCGATSLKRLQDKSFAPLQKLKILDLSNTRIKRLPIFQDPKRYPFLKSLKRLLLSGCDRLERLPSLKPLSGLQILDLSGTSMLKECSDETFEKNDVLKILDLSGTSLTQLSFEDLNLRELKLRGCSKLKELPCTITLEGLELLDLSNASSLDRIKDESFEHLRLLRYLNLSNTMVINLPSLSNLPNLRELLLRNCLCIKKLKNINQLKRLEVLDVSGCQSLTEIQEQSFMQMPKLRNLNFSETKIEFLPALCNPGNLHCLELRNCTNLKKIFPLESLSKLEVLDLSGSSSLSEIKVEFFRCLTFLETINLSGVEIVGDLTMPHFSKLTNLTQLSLKNCLALEAELNLEVLKQLKILDFSGTAVQSLSSLEKLTHLEKLLLRDCLNLKKLPSLKLLTRLQVLDLSGTGIKEIPDGISELTCLSHLDLPDLKVLQEVGWEKIKQIPRELNWDRCNISEPVEILSHGIKKPSVLVNGTKFFQVLRENPKLREICLKQMFLSVCPVNHSNYDNFYPLKDDLMNNIYLQLRHFFSVCKEQGQTIELRGFEEFPTDLEDVLKDVEYLSLVENKFLSGLSDLGVDNLKKMRGCWLEKCSEMKIIFSDGTDLKLGIDLETLWISNLSMLQSLCCKMVNLNNLQHLHIDCCPKLENAFPQAPVLESLKTLEIRFCDNLKTVFMNDEPGTYSLLKLHTVHLLQLPELTSIGAMLPCLDILDQKECPKLQDSKESLKSGVAL